MGCLRDDSEEGRNIIPIGVVSKNDIGDLRRRPSAPRNILRAAYSPTNEKIQVKMKEKNP
jgi:hypothetical protein